MPTFQVSLIPSCFRSRRGAAPGCSPYPHQMVKRLNQRHKPTERKVTALPCPLHTRSTCVETQMATLPSAHLTVLFPVKFVFSLHSGQLVQQCTAFEMLV